jgi:signal transduction histidine kinase
VYRIPQRRSKSDLANIFDCFHQSCDKKTASTGMGLGLFLVRELVQLHGGSAQAMSDGPGTGATFCVSIPLRTG